MSSLSASGISSAQTFSNPLNSTASQKEIDIPKRILEKLESGDFLKNKTELFKDFSQITQEQLKEVLIAFFKESIAKFKGQDPIKAAEKLAEMIPFEKLEEAVFSDQETALKKAKSLFNQAKYYLENSKAKASPSLKSKLSKILNAMISFIESILSAFGIRDFFNHASTQLQRQFKFHKIAMLISFFSMLTTLLLPLLGAALTAPIVGGSLLLIGVCSVIWPKIAPAPSHLPCGAENWTEKCNSGEFDSLSFSKGRKNIIDEIANTLISSKNGQLKKHPLLKGESRVGKNETVKAFVQALEKGSYPELKGKKVFYLNAAGICQKGDPLEGKDGLTQICDAIGRHKNHVILVVDEIQAPFMSEKNLIVGQKLKSMLDADGAFPYVIGITTSKELTEKINDDAAFVNRFNLITVESTGPEVTQEILAHSVLAKGKSVLCGKNALEIIYQKTKEGPQPYSSDLLLSKCIEMTSRRQSSPLASKIQELKNKREFLSSRGVFSSFSMGEEGKIASEIEVLEKQIKNFEKEVTEEKKAFDHLFQKKEAIFDVKAKIYRTVMKVADVKASCLSKKDKVQLSTFVLMSRFLAPALDAYVQERAKDLGVGVVIDEEVIDEAAKTLSSKE